MVIAIGPNMLHHLGEEKYFTGSGYCQVAEVRRPCKKIKLGLTARLSLQFSVTGEYTSSIVERKYFVKNFDWAFRLVQNNTIQVRIRSVQMSEINRKYSYLRNSLPESFMTHLEELDPV